MRPRPPLPPPPADAARDVPAFLRRVRRRLLARDLLLAAAAAGLANEALRWAAVAANLLARREAPVVDAGPILLLVLAAAALRRGAPARAARLVDRRAGLYDRLTSFLEFSAREDLPADVRAAQGAETARALAIVRVAAVAPLHPVLALGPLALAASLFYPLLLPVVETTTTQVARRVVRVAGDAASPRGAREAGEPLRAPRADAPREPGPAPSATTPRAATPDERLARPAPPRGERTGGPDEPPVTADRATRPKDHPDREQPSRIRSERVGSALARVVDPLHVRGAGARADAPVPTGAHSFRLVPKRSGRGEGAAPAAGEGAAPEAVFVDFDLLPERYRPLVRTYFQALAAHAAGP